MITAASTAAATTTITVTTTVSTTATATAAAAATAAFIAAIAPAGPAVWGTLLLAWGALAARLLQKLLPAPARARAQ
jgi:hypothetical protein